MNQARIFKKINVSQTCPIIKKLVGINFEGHKIKISQMNHNSNPKPNLKTIDKLKKYITIPIIS